MIIQSKKISNLFTDIDLQMELQQMTDEQLQQYEQKLIQLSQKVDFSFQESIQILKNAQIYSKIQGNHQIQSLNIKTDFIDLLEGENHSVFYLGQKLWSQNASKQLVDSRVLKQFVQIIFRISQQQKIIHPHLFTHVKQQFYKPNIFQNDTIDQSQLKRKKFIIDEFFQKNNQEKSYSTFIHGIPQFQQICLIVFDKIVSEQKYKMYRDNQNLISEKEAIEILCKKFLIEIKQFQVKKGEIKVIVIGGDERFLFVWQKNHIFLVILEKLQLLSSRRKSSHNISVHQKDQNAMRKNSINTIKSKGNNWKQNNDVAYFKMAELSDRNENQLIRTENAVLQQKGAHNLKIYLNDNIYDSDQTSNQDSSVLKAESRIQQVSDQSTPKFKHSSIANKNHIRKKSHKDSFGGVDFDNIVYKDLSNPKRFIEQKGLRQQKQKDKFRHNFSKIQSHNKKVLSQRFQAQDMGSLTYDQDQQSSIEYVLQFQQKRQNISIHGQQPSSPTHSNNSFLNFPGKKNIEDQKRFILIKKMKGSNIEKVSPYFGKQQEMENNSPKLKHKNSNNHSNYLSRSNTGSRLLASSEIIQYSGNYDKNQKHKGMNQNEQQSSHFKPSYTVQYRSQQKINEPRSLIKGSGQNDVFMSFSKNDKQKFIIADCKQFEVFQSNNIKSPSKINLPQSSYRQQDHTSDQILDLLNDQEVKSKIRKYSYRTQKQQRQKFKQKCKQEINPSEMELLKKNSQNHSSNQIFNQFQNNSQQISGSMTTIQANEILKKNIAFKVQRKQSSYVPLPSKLQNQYDRQMNRSTEIPIHKVPMMNRFEENSVRFSQIVQDNEDQMFYAVRKNPRNEGMTNNNNSRKQRKVTDFYQSPSLLRNSGGNRTSQIIEKGESFNSQNQLRFQGTKSHLDVSIQNTSILFNSGGGKNYSVLSNISYDEERRLEDLIQLQHQQQALLTSNGRPIDYLQKDSHFRNSPTNQLSQSDFTNIQMVQKLLAKKRQQKNKLQSGQINVLIESLKINEPFNWVKKEVIYYFEPIMHKSPQKYTYHNNKVSINYTPQPIFNSQNQQHRFVNIKEHKEKPNERKYSNNFIAPAASLYNYNSFRFQNPQLQFKDKQQQRSFSNNSQKERELSIYGTINKPQSQINLKINKNYQQNTNNNRKQLIQRNEFPQKQSLISPAKNYILYSPPPMMYNQHSQQHRNLNNINTVRKDNINQGFVYTRPQTQYLRTYPSQPVIKFTVGDSKLSRQNNINQRYIPAPVKNSLGTFGIRPYIRYT